MPGSAGADATQTVNTANDVRQATMAVVQWMPSHIELAALQVHRALGR
jgi:hypothetical protein